MQKKILVFSLFLSLVFVNFLFAQVASVTISGIVTNKNKTILPYTTQLL